MSQQELQFETPQHRYVTAIKDLTVVHLVHWEGWWDRWAPWTKKEGDAS